ncbi:hypothetical protein Tco_1507403 [Tanacetum coccineum]
MSTLAEHIIVAGAENRPPMLEKSMYDSWASRIRLFIKGKKHGRMMLDLIDNGLLVYPTVEENGQTRPKKYFELTEAQQLQDDCDVQATNIILHGLPPDVYALVNHQEAAKDIWDRLINDMHTIGMTMQQVQVNTKFLNALPSEWREVPIECINKAMEFLSAVASRFPPSNNQLKTSSIPRKQATIQDGRVTIQQVQGRQNQSYAGTRNRGIATTSKRNVAAGPSRILDEEQLAFLADPGISEAPVAQQTIPHNSAFQTYDSDYDDLSSAKAVLMENLSSCNPEVLFEIPYFDSYLNDMINQDVQEM